MIKIGKPRKKLLILPRTRRTTSQRVRGGAEEAVVPLLFPAAGFARWRLLAEGARGLSKGKAGAGGGQEGTWAARVRVVPALPHLEPCLGAAMGQVTLSPCHRVAPNPGHVGKATSLSYRERAGPSFSFSIGGDVSRIK